MNDIKNELNMKLNRAAVHEDEEGMKRALEEGADINERDEHGYTALINATVWGCTKAVRFLIENGADVNITYSRPEYSGPETTPLMFTMVGKGKRESKMVELAKILLENGAKIDAREDDGSTALIWASDGYKKLTKLFIENGANMEFRNADGQTALDRARDQGETGTAKILERAKEMQSMPDDNKNSALTGKRKNTEKGKGPGNKIKH